MPLDPAQLPHIQSILDAVLAGQTRWAVIEGDCLDVLPLLPDRSVAHVIADPPYSEHTHQNMRGNRTERGGEKTIVTRDTSFKPITRELRQGIGRHACRVATGWIAVFSDWESIGPWRVAIEDIGGGSYRRAVPWVRWSSPQFNKQAPPCGSEAVIWSKPQCRETYWEAGGRMSYDTKCLRSSNKVADYDTEKPLELMLEIVGDVRACGTPNNIILDCTCGSGTTLVAALRLGMRCIGIELAHAGAEVAARRCAAEVRGLDLDAADSGQRSIFDAQLQTGV